VPADLRIELSVEDAHAARVAFWFAYRHNPVRFSRLLGHAEPLVYLGWRQGQRFSCLAARPGLAALLGVV
jgi:hypothetical protein